MKYLAIIVLVIFVNSVSAEITSSAHDFSTEGWSGGKICEVCHTPHNANMSVTDAPLWNHEVTTASFTLYNSSTMGGIVESPRGPSKLCLSCHDGTIAPDSYGDNIGSATMPAEAIVGTDLSDDHPVSIKWEHRTISYSNSDLCANCHLLNPWGFNNKVPFFDGYLECSTCHDVHNGLGYSKLLRRPLAGSDICLYCHTDKL